MIENLPIYISVIFGITTLLTLLLFYLALRNSENKEIRSEATLIILGLIVWLILQAFLGITDVYNSDATALPPPLVLFGVLPAIVLIVLMFVTRNGKRFVDSLPLINITNLNVVRVFVEIVLFLLFVQKAVPQLMTFSGRNFDILAGLSAPFIAYYGLKKFTISRRMILIWNIISLLLLANIVIHAVLSIPSPFQKLAFDQPNIAVLNFPFCWLPTFIVPLILFGHLVSIRQLIRNNPDDDL
ncbi:MAG: hypothetical protein V4556_08870 [Bacteroidota bacterium]